MAATASRSSVGVISWGLPPRRPCARAVAKPALVRSDDQLAPELRDDGEDAEGELAGRRRGVTAAPWPLSTSSPTPRPAGSRTRSTGRRRSRPSRSSFRTTGSAPSRGASG